MIKARDIEQKSIDIDMRVLCQSTGKRPSFGPRVAVANIMR